ncbi:hypothetical protein B0H14DRAFT_2563163 [Mycena olivaceomarginata]|nr:hypothetical protein B0H14DRAFT_2563163 [Mycena olivaceomarginata]
MVNAVRAYFFFQWPPPLPNQPKREGILGVSMANVLFFLSLGSTSTRSAHRRRRHQYHPTASASPKTGPGPVDAVVLAGATADTPGRSPTHPDSIVPASSSAKPDPAILASSGAKPNPTAHAISSAKPNPAAPASSSTKPSPAAHAISSTKPNPAAPASRKINHRTTGCKNGYAPVPSTVTQNQPKCYQFPSNLQVAGRASATGQAHCQVCLISDLETGLRSTCNYFDQVLFKAEKACQEIWHKQTFDALAAGNVGSSQGVEDPKAPVPTLDVPSEMLAVDLKLAPGDEPAWCKWQQQHFRLNIPALQLIRLVHSHSSSFAGTSVGIVRSLCDACDQLLGIMADTPKMQLQLVSSHGTLAILEVLEGKCSQDDPSYDGQEWMQLFSPGLMPFPNVLTSLDAFTAANLTACPAFFRCTPSSKSSSHAASVHSKTPPGLLLIYIANSTPLCDGSAPLTNTSTRQSIYTLKKLQGMLNLHT